MAHTKKETYNMLFKEYPDVVSISQLSQILHISEKTAYKLLRENEIGHFKIGRTYKIPKLSVLSYMSVEN